MTALLGAVFFLWALLGAVRPLWAMAGVLVGLPAYLARGAVGGFPTTVLEAMILGLVVGWVASGVRPSVSRRRWMQLRSSWSGPGVAFVGLLILGWAISAISSIDQRASLGAVKSWLIEPLLLAVMLLSQPFDQASRRLLHRAMSVALLWVSLAGLIQVVWIRSTVEGGRLSSVFAPVANYYAMFVVPLMALSLGRLIENRRDYLALASVAAGGLGLLLSISFGGLLGFGAGALVLVGTTLRSPIRRRAMLAIVGLGVALIAILLPTRFGQEKFNTVTRSSSLVRLEIWETAWLIGREHPLAGIGPNAFELAYRQTVPRVAFPPLEWLVAKPHNLYLSAWVETGLLGAIGLIGLLLLGFRRALAAGRTIPHQCWYAAALAAILVHGLLDTPIMKNDLAAMTAVILALIASPPVPKNERPPLE